MRLDTVGRTNQMSPNPFQTWATMNLWDEKNWKSQQKKNNNFCCYSSHSSHFLIPLVCRRKDIFRPWTRNKPMVLQVPLFNYCLVKLSNIQCILLCLLFFIICLFMKKKKIKSNKRLTGRICGCLIWASLVSSNNPAHWWFLVLAELYRIYYPCPFYCRRIMVWGRKRKGHYFSRLFSQQKGKSYRQRAVCFVRHWIFLSGNI